MIDERLYADLVDLYHDNVKAYKDQNTGIIIENVYPLSIEDVEKVFDTKAVIDYEYIKKNFISFTVNPQVTEMKIKNDVTYVDISPDISWEKQIHND